MAVWEPIILFSLMIVITGSSEFTLCHGEDNDGARDFCLKMCMACVLGHGRTRVWMCNGIQSSVHNVNRTDCTPCTGFEQNKSGVASPWKITNDR